MKILVISVTRNRKGQAVRAEHAVEGELLRIGRGSATSEGQETPARQKAAGHLVAGHGQARRLRLEERRKDIIAAQQLSSSPSDERFRVDLHRGYPPFP